MSIHIETPIQHHNFSKVMKIGQSKKALFNMIADEVNLIQSEKVIVCTRESGVVSNMPLDTSRLHPCNQEEADTRLFIHVMDASVNGSKKIMIITVDTDVVVIAIYVFFSLDVQELWIEFGSGMNRRWLPVHLYAYSLGEEICRAIPFWYALTGCDTVSNFASCCKKKAW